MFSEKEDKLRSNRNGGWIKEIGWIKGFPSVQTNAVN